MGQRLNTVTDDKYLAASKNPDYCRIIKAVTNGFSKQLDLDAREACGLMGLWKALKKFDPSYGQKFTSSLHRYVKWACLNELKRAKREASQTVRLHEGNAPLSPPLDTDKIDFSDKVAELPKKWRKLIEWRYHDRRTIQEISKKIRLSRECTRLKIKTAVRKLMKLCGVS